MKYIVYLDDEQALTLIQQGKGFCFVDPKEMLDVGDVVRFCDDDNFLYPGTYKVTAKFDLTRTLVYVKRINK